MADKTLRGLLLTDFEKCSDTGSSVQNNPGMKCLICDTDVNSHNSYNVFCDTVLPRGGTFLCDDIENILQRTLNAVTVRSSIICNRCFSLFDELAVTEHKCLSIKTEIATSYRRTCEIHDDHYEVEIPGVACQTEFMEGINLHHLELDTDISASIPSPPLKKKRGRRKKNNIEEELPLLEDNSDTTHHLFNPINLPAVSKKKTKHHSKDSNDIVSEETSLAIRSRRTRSSTRASNSGRSPEVFDVDVDPFVWRVEVEDIRTSREDNIDLKTELDPDVPSPVIKDSGNISDDDDFEWKEDPLTDSDCISGNETNDHQVKDLKEEDWHSEEHGKVQASKKVKKKRKRKHGERAFMPPIHECNQCGKKWRTLTELKAHIASHSDIRPFVCEICGQAYKIKKAFDIHIGMHNGIHPFVCSYCNKSFTQKVGLEKHLPIHTGVARFQCDLCGKRFIHQKSFNIHKMTHTGEKNIHCPICKLAVFSRSHLKRHNRVHTGERPYGCTICGKKFAEKYNLNAHVKIHNPSSTGETRRKMPVQICPVCGLTFDKKQKLAEHLSSAHCSWQNQPPVEYKPEEFFNLESLEASTQTPIISTVSQGNHIQDPDGHLLQQPQPDHLQTANLLSLQERQPQQHHQIVQQIHEQDQHNRLHQLQPHHHQSVSQHHIIVSQNPLQQTVQAAHLNHHPVAMSSTVVTPASPPPLQPISSVFQLVSVQSAAMDAPGIHLSCMNSTVTTSVSSL